MNEKIPTSIIPENECEARYLTVARPRQDVAREVFNIRAIDIMFKYKSTVEMVLSPEWQEASQDLMNMAGKELHGQVLSEFFVRNASVINRKRTDWTDLKKF